VWCRRWRLSLLRRGSIGRFRLKSVGDRARIAGCRLCGSGGYFQKRGWHPVVVPSEHFAPWVLRNSGAEAGLKGSLAAALMPAGRPAAVACPFDTHTLYGASRRCARYDYNSAAGDKRLPLFEVRSSGSQQEVWQRQRCVQLGSLCAAQMWLE